MMRPYRFLLLNSAQITVFSQRTFEESNFNATKALLDSGVNDSVLAYIHGRPSTNTCEIACDALEHIFGDAKVERRGESGYDTVIDYFWSAQQREPQPYCIFKPEKATEVSILVLLARLISCAFAVRSGGHASFAGASSMDNGITVTFERMKEITLSKDKEIASIESGNLWYDIYTRLAEDSLAVTGGRVAAIGIGGLTTGGGISYFANKNGWACDNVASYEVVTASGRIVTASSDSYPDLFYALRGGGNNFGIVTRFSLETFPHSPLMFGGQRRFFNASFPAVIDAFVELGVNAGDDPKAAQFVAITMIPESGTTVALAELQYADPVLDAPIFENYRNIEAFSDTTKLDTLAYFTQQLNDSNPKGYRETYWTATSKLTKEMVKIVFDISFEEFEKIRDVEGLVPANTLQIITIPQLEKMQRKGGNALGLTPDNGPLLLINPTARWKKKEDDARVLAAARNIVSRMQEEAEKLNLSNTFLYMNYASQFQDVIGSYGASNVARLKQIALRYDPDGVFQRLQPGYFKLNGPPAMRL